MWWILLIPFLATAALGVTYIVTHVSVNTARITAVVVTAASVLGISFWSYTIAHGMSQRGAVSGYRQYLNSSVVSTNVSTTSCSRDGSCRHTYRCDSYQQWEKTGTRTVYYTDSSGKSKSRQVDVYGWVTHWHSCPYATKEYTYTVLDGLGNTHTIASHVFADNPQQWRSGHGFPSGVGQGVPAQWQHARSSIAAGNADPVTVTGTYSNFILASNSTILKSYSDDIKKLQKKRLLPEAYINPVRSHYQSDKVAWVGASATNNAAWQNTLARFNAALGMQKQGDMHVVVVRSSALRGVTSANDYAQAVKAYWLNNLGKSAMAKNAILVVLGVDDSMHTVEWANATTGMPEGNGGMLNAIKLRLAGTTFSPDATIGDVRASVSAGNKISYQIGSGTLTQTVFKDFPFKRACMDCKDKGDDGTGYVYLSSDIPISGLATFWTIMINLTVVAIIWTVLFRLRAGSSEYLDHRNPSVRRSYTTPY